MTNTALYTSLRSGDPDAPNQRVVVVRYFLDRAGYGLPQSSARLWRCVPEICRVEDIRSFLSFQGITYPDDNLLAEVYLDRYECYMALEALDADVFFDFSTTSASVPGILNFRLTDLSSGVSAEQKQAGSPIQSGFCTLTPLGLFAFSLTVILDFAHILGRLVENSVDPSFYLIWGPYAFFVSGLCQVITGLVEASRNNVYGGTAFIAFGCFWLANATRLILTSFFPDQIPPEYTGTSDPVGDFLRDLFIFAFVCVLFKQTLVASKLASTLIALLAVKVFAASLSGWSEAMEWIELVFSLFVALMAFYMFTAEFTNEVYQKEVFKMYRWSVDSPEQLFAAAGRSASLLSKAASLRAAHADEDKRATFHELRSVQPKEIPEKKDV